MSNNRHGSLSPSAAVWVQVQDCMMQEGQGWHKDVLALPGCAAQLGEGGKLVW